MSEPAKKAEGHYNIIKDYASDNLPQLAVKSSLPSDYQYDSITQNSDLNWSKTCETKIKMDLLAVPSSPVDELNAPPCFKTARINSTVEFK